MPDYSATVGGQTYSWSAEHDLSPDEVRSFLGKSIAANGGKITSDMPMPLQLAIANASPQAGHLKEGGTYRPPGRKASVSRGTTRPGIIDPSLLSDQQRTQLADQGSTFVNGRQIFASQLKPFKTPTPQQTKATAAAYEKAHPDPLIAAAEDVKNAIAQAPSQAYTSVTGLSREDAPYAHAALDFVGGFAAFPAAITQAGLTTAQHPVGTVEHLGSTVVDVLQSANFFDPNISGPERFGRALNAAALLYGGVEGVRGYLKTPEGIAKFATLKDKLKVSDHGANVALDSLGRDIQHGHPVHPKENIHAVPIKETGGVGLREQDAVGEGLGGQNRPVEAAAESQPPAAPQQAQEPVAVPTSVESAGNPEAKQTPASKPVAATAKVETPAYTIKATTRSKDSIVVNEQSTNGLKTHAHTVAESLGGRYSHQAGGYVLPASQELVFRHLMGEDVPEPVVKRGTKAQMAISEKKHSDQLREFEKQADNPDKPTFYHKTQGANWASQASPRSIGAIPVANDRWIMPGRLYEVPLSKLMGDMEPEAPTGKHLISEHRAVVEQRINEGKPVPPEVLADYPDLKPPPTEVKPTETPKPSKLDSVKKSLDDIIAQTDADLKKGLGNNRQSGATNIPTKIVNVAARALRAAIETGETVWSHIQRIGKEDGLTDAEKALALSHAKELNDQHGIELGSDHFASDTKGIAKDLFDSTGLAHQVNQREIDEGLSEIKRLPGITPEKAHAEGKAAVDSGEIDPFALAKSIADHPRVPDFKEFGALLEGKRRLKLDIKNAKSPAEAKAAIDALEEFGNQVKVGSNQWHRAGQALQAGTTLDYGEFADVIERQQKTGAKHTEADIEALRQLTEQHAKAQEGLSKIEADDLMRRHAELESELERRRMADLQKEAMKNRRRASRNPDISVREKAVRDSALAKLQAKWKASGSALHSDVTGGVASTAIRLADIAPEVLEITKSYIREGAVKAADGIDAATDKVHAILKDALPGLTKDHVRDIVAGRYEKTPTKALPETQELADLRRQAQDQIDAPMKEQKANIEGLTQEARNKATQLRLAQEKGLRETKAILDLLDRRRTREAQRQIARIERERIAEARKAGRALTAKARAEYSSWWRTTDGAERIRLLDNIAKTQAKIEQGSPEFIGPKRGPKTKFETGDPVVENLQTQLDQVKEELKSKVTDPERLRKRLDEMKSQLSDESKMEEGNQKRQANKIKRDNARFGASDEVKNLRYEIEQARRRIDEIGRNASMGTGQKIWRNTIDVSRAIAIPFHAVGMVTHAGPSMFSPTEFRAWGEGFKQQFKFLVDPVAHADAMHTLTKQRDFHFWLEQGLNIDPHKVYDSYQQYQHVFGKIGEGSANSMDALKVFRHRIASEALAQFPEHMRADVAPEIAKWANRVGGSRNSPKGTGALARVARGAYAVADEALFGSSLEGSRWGRMTDTLNPKNLTDLFSGNEAQQAVARFKVKRATKLFAVYTGFLAANYGLQSLTGQDDKVNLADPTKSDWLDFKWNGHTLGLLSGVQNAPALMVKIFANLAGKNPHSREKDPQDAESSILARYGRGKLTPALSIATELKFGHDYRGRPLPWSSDEGTDKRPKYTALEWAIKHGPIPLSEGATTAYDEMRESGASHSDAAQLLNGVVAAAFAQVGARVGQTPKASEPSTSTGPKPSRPPVRKPKSPRP